MFTCVLRPCVASAVLVTQLVESFTEGADSGRLMGAISVNRRADVIKKEEEKKENLKQE